MSSEASSGREIAVVGMSCRLPGAPDLASFWRNLAAGVESISFFSPEEMRAAGVDPRLLADPRWVGAKAMIEGEDLFDAAFFGLTPREAEILDPQHRLFLECAWEALEHAAIDPGRFRGPIAVFAGAGASSYAWNVLGRHPTLLASAGAFQVALGNDKDYLATRVAYKLDLRGPSFSVQSACSTSLVAIALATQSLLAWECDAALAGGSTLAIPQLGGYLYQEGGILSPDGHCRPFDAAARGTAPGSGVGVVVLKRLADALAAGDPVWAVVEAVAVNNDGAEKVGFTAPSSAGQHEVIALAHALAGVDPGAITYVEAHGTATALGDPIEVEALTRAFRDGSDERGFCALGSVKSNFGHLDTAAGVAGFIKTVLALHHRAIPPSLHFTRPNPAIDFASSPFYVARELAPWDTDRLPRRAGVSSFGIGGTNAHAVLAEAPERAPSGPSRPWQLLLLSAKTETALERASENLAAHFEAEPPPTSAELADVAHTLRLGRRPFPRRRAVLCRTAEEAVASLRSLDPERVATGFAPADDRPVAFLLPGQGAQRAGMGAELYRQEPVFRDVVDQAAEGLAEPLGLDLRRLLFPAPGEQEQAELRLADTRFTQPALFVVEVALSALWRSWGVEPAVLLGHSIGELAAAHLAGVFSFDDGLALLAERGRLLSELPAGAMLAVPLPEAEIEPLLGDGAWVSAVNAADRTTVGGTPAAIDELARRLTERGLEGRQLATSHAFHTPLVEPILAAWEAALRSVALSPPARPYVSNLTGRFATAEEATDPATWVRHLREPVRFHEGLATLLGDERRLLLEVGPGRTLAGLVRRSTARRGALALPSLPEPGQGGELERMLGSLGRLWIAGAGIDWPRFADGEQRARRPLPTYPFERKRFWIDLPAAQAPALAPPPRARHDRPQIGTAYAAPEGELERSLAAIWEELLGSAPIGRRDDFFELGGDSLLLVQLLGTIEERLGVALPLAGAIERPTIEALAPRVRAGAAASPRVELQPLGAEPPLWLIHPVGGTVAGYVELARRLEGRRVVALQAAGVEAGEAPLPSVAAAAERAHRLIVEGQASGPYLLAGWSFGGLVAFELARRLEAEGERVDLLALLDSRPVPPEVAAQLGDPAQQVDAFFQDLAGGRLPAAAVEPAGPADRFEDLLARARQARLLPGRGGEERARRLFAVFAAQSSAAASYRPGGPVAAPTLLLEAEEDLFADAGHARLSMAAAWGPLLTGPVERHVVPGHHYSMLASPQAQAVAARLATALTRLAPGSQEALLEDSCSKINA